MLRLALTMLAFAVLASGCAQPATPADATAATADPVVAPQHVSADGSLALGDCGATPGGNACLLNVGDPTKGGASSNILHFPVAGTAGLHATGGATLTWTASTPLNDDLVLRVTLLRDCAKACATDKVVAETTGPSPLAISAPDVLVPDGDLLGFTVLRSASGPQGMSTFQDVHIEGDVTVATTPA